MKIHYGKIQGDAIFISNKERKGKYMNLKRYCRVKEVKIKDLADKLGVSMGYLSGIMYDKRKVSDEMAKKIYEVTEGQVTEEDLYPHHKCPKCGHEFIEK